MTVFDDIVQRVLKEEGVLSNHPHDAGGLTNLGITKPFLSDYLRRPATDADIYALTEQKAITVYRVMLWERTHINLIQDPKLAEVVFDYAVNSGAGRAIRELQKMLELPTDGILGPATLAALPLDSREFRNQYVIERGRWLMDLAQHNKNNVDFIEGWYMRIIRQLDFAYDEAKAQTEAPQQ